MVKKNKDKIIKPYTKVVMTTDHNAILKKGEIVYYLGEIPNESGHSLVLTTSGIPVSTGTYNLREYVEADENTLHLETIPTRNSACYEKIFVTGNV